VKFFKILLLIAPALIFSDFAFAQTWTPTTQSGNWYSIASSADGTKLVAVGYSGIYTSTNSGASWMQQTNAPNLSWYSVASPPFLSS
jgi:hypothetical protein